MRAVILETAVERLSVLTRSVSNRSPFDALGGSCRRSCSARWRVANRCYEEFGGPAAFQFQTSAVSAFALVQAQVRAARRRLDTRTSR